MAHPNERLTPLGRDLLVRRIVEDGWPVPVAAARLGVARATAYKWLARYRAFGPAGLVDRPRRPHTSPRALAAVITATVLIVRRERREGPHRLAARLGLARSTVYRVLQRQRESRLGDRGRCTRQVVRYERERPGDLVHLDVKKLGRIPDGGRHRAGRGWATSICRPPSMITPASPSSRSIRTSAPQPVPPSSMTRPPSSRRMGSQVRAC